MQLLEKFLQKDGSLAINRKRKLRPRQRAALKRLPEAAQLQYLMSLLGMLPKQKLETIAEMRWREIRAASNKIGRYNQDGIIGRRLPGYFVDAFRMLCNPAIDHTPTQKNVGQWLGVEIEFFIPRDSVDCPEVEHCSCETDEGGNPIGTCCYGRGQENKAGFDLLTQKLRAAKVTRACVKEDGSLFDEDNNGIPIELTLLLTPSDGFKQLQKACKVISSLGGYINNSCGLHVHLDARHLDKRQAAKIGERLGYALPVLQSMVPKSRHNNSYCKLQVSDIDDTCRDSRYAAINLYAYKEKQTIEVRLHSGTTCAKKISNWITILRCIVASDLDSELTDLQSFIDNVKVPEHVLEYMDKRITKFSEGASEDAHASNVEPILANAEAMPLCPVPNLPRVTRNNQGLASTNAIINSVVPNEYVSGMSLSYVPQQPSLFGGPIAAQEPESTLPTLRAERRFLLDYIATAPESLRNQVALLMREARQISVLGNLSDAARIYAQVRTIMGLPPLLAPIRTNEQVLEDRCHDYLNRIDAFNSLVPRGHVLNHGMEWDNARSFLNNAREYMRGNNFSAALPLLEHLMDAMGLVRANNSQEVA